MDTTKLSYTVLPKSVYYTRDSRNPSLAVITIGASNTTEADINIIGFQVQIPISNDPKNADALTSVPSSILPISLQPTIWSFDQIDDGIYRASPIISTTVVKPGQSITFQLQGVTVNQAAGTSILTITERDSEGNDNIVTRQVVKTKSALDIKDFKANPDHIVSGGSATLSWATEAAARVTLIPGDYPDIKPNDSVIVHPGTTTTYTLTAYGEGPNVSKQYIVAIDAPEIVSFAPSSKMVNAGDKVTLSWEVKNSDDISISPGDHKNLPAKGELKDIVVWNETNFIITASNKGNENVNRPASVGINPVIINSFKATPAYGARLGEPVALSWDVKSAVTASVQFGTINSITQSQLNNGTLSIIPSTGVAYSLVAQNSLGTAMSSIELLPMPIGWYKYSSNAPFKFPEPPLVLKFKNDMWAMASNLMNSVYYSFDGANWVPATNTIPWQTRSYSAGVVFKDKMWLMGGKSTSGSCLNDVWSSTDGKTWTPETNAAQWPARRSFGCFVLPGIDKIFVVGGLDNAGNSLNDVWSSLDGKAWTKETDSAFSAGRAAFGTAVFNNTAWVVAGLTGGAEGTGTPTNDVWYSTNGSQWSMLTQRPNWQERYYPSVGGLSNGLYVCGGIDSGGKGLNDLNKMTADQKWSMLPGPAWGDVKVSAGLEYQDALWCVGGGLNTGKPNTAVWAYAPSLVT